MVRAFAFDRHFEGASARTPFDEGPARPRPSDAPFEPLFVAAPRPRDGREDFAAIAFRSQDGGFETFDRTAADDPFPGEDLAVLDSFEAGDAPPPPEDVFGEDDLVGVFADDAPSPGPSFDPLREQAIREEAYAEGERQGYDRGRVDAEAALAASQEARVIEAMEALAASIPDARGQIDALLERVERRASRLAFAVVRKLAPALESGVARDMAARLMSEALKAAGAAPFIVVETSADLGELLESRLEDLRTLVGSRAEIEIRSLEEASPGHLRVLWETGGVEYDVTGASSVIMDLITRAEEAAAGSVWEAA